MEKKSHKSFKYTFNTGENGSDSSVILTSAKTELDSEYFLSLTKEKYQKLKNEYQVQIKNNSNEEENPESYIENNNNNVDKAIVQSLKKSFPYKAFFIKNEKILQSMKALAICDGRFKKRDTFEFEHIDVPIKNLNINYKNKQDKQYYYEDSETDKPLTLVFQPETYEKINFISDAFKEVEHTRIKIFYIGDKNPLDCYKENTLDLFHKCMNKYQELNAKNLREIIYENTYEAGPSKPMILAGMIELLFDKKEISNLKIIEPCIGRGCDYLTAVAKNIKLIVGIDPDEGSKRCFEVLNEFLKNTYPKNETILKFHQERFEIFNIPQEYGQFDLGFCSPPYFDLETYNSEDKNQSINMFPTVKSWKTGFAYPLLKKVFDSLKVGGYLIFNLNDSNNRKKEKFTLDCVDYAIKMEGCDFLGMIPFAQEVKEKDESGNVIKITYKHAQPLWIFIKSS